MLPPGSQLDFRLSECNITQYANIDKVKIKHEVNKEQGSDLIWNYLNDKISNYSSLAETHFVGLLSGGWDSRLIVAFLKEHHALTEAYTTEQGLNFWGRFFSEGKIAQDVAKFLNIKNQYVEPKSSKNLFRTAQLVDYSTSFHSWILPLIDELPEGEVFIDGFLGDVLLRGTHIYGDFNECLKKQDKSKAAELIFSEYISGTNAGSASTTSYPDLKNWQEVLDPTFVAEALSNLKQFVKTEIDSIKSENFLSMYQIRNRQRRCISWLPLAVIGSKGSTILPFCDPEFVELSLSLPLDIKQDHSLYNSILEKTKPGLSKIPSSNSKNKKELNKYMRVNNIKLEEIFFSVFNSLPQSLRWRIWKRFGFLSYFTSKARFIAGEVIKNPPNSIMHLLSPEIQKAIKSKRKLKLVKYSYHLQQLLVLDRFYTNQIYIHESDQEID